MRDTELSGAGSSFRSSKKRKIGLSLLVVPIVLFAGYCLIRDPAWRAFDFLMADRYWSAAWMRVVALPMKIEPFLLSTGIIRYQPLPVQLKWGATMMLDPVDLVDRELMVHSAWEETEWSWVQSALREGDTFVDVGAHHGTYSLRAAKLVGAGGRVISVEPNPPTIRQLRENIALSRATNVIVEEVACGESEGRLTLYVAANRNTGMASFGRETARSSGAGGALVSHEVPVIPLDQLLSQRHPGRVAVIKIDTEGAETMVLRGSMETLRKYKPVVVIETVSRHLESMNSSMAELKGVLRSCGYHQVTTTGSNGLWKAD